MIHQSATAWARWLATNKPTGAIHVGVLPTPFVEAPQAALASGKPVGLWYGVGSAWLDWCISEGFTPTWRAEPLVYAVARPVDVLRIATPRELHDFAAAFRHPEPYLRVEHFIDWSRVAARWPGIEIAPYQYSCRLDPAVAWYYGWDCASGCIWRDAHVEVLGALTRDSKEAS